MDHGRLRWANVAQIAFRGKEWFFSGDPSLRIRTSFKFSNQLLIKWLYSMPIYLSIVSLALLMRILVKQNNALFSTFHRPTSSVRKVWHHTFSPVCDDFPFFVVLLLFRPIFPLTTAPPQPITPITHHHCHTVFLFRIRIALLSLVF